MAPRTPPIPGMPDPADGHVPDMTDHLEATILRLLDERAEGATICPSEVAREVGTPEGWRELMDPVRRAARRLVEQDLVEVTQGGRVVDLDRARGPVRIRRAG